jgi:malonyl-CoA O-methyltransferase
MAAPRSSFPAASAEAGARPASLDPAQVRRQFARAASNASAYDSAAALLHEVAKRMLERLEVVRLEPAVVIDAGSGSGHALAGLEARFPQATIVALDSALPMLARNARSARRGLPEWIQRLVAAPRVAAVAADFGRLPFREASVGCVWSNLALHWTNEPDQVLAEWSRVLVTGGLAQFSVLGPDTLQQLRAAWGADSRRVHRFIDMHDIGDMLIEAGFADPVMDMEVVTLTYRSLDDLLAELRATGSTNARVDRPRGLTGKNRWRAMSNAYESMRRDGTLPATFEIVYGHAWKAAPRADKDGVARVRVEDIGRGRRQG